MITNEWRKSTRSNDGGSCVELRTPDGGQTVAMRDTKQDGRGPALQFDRETWLGFIADVRSGEFDL